MYASDGDSPDQRRWRRDWRELVAAFVAGAVLSGVLTGILVHNSQGSRRVVTSAATDRATSTSAAGTDIGTATTPTTALPIPTSPTTATPPTTAVSPPTTAITSATTGTSTGAITGTVRDYAGHPVPGAYVIGLETLTVARTDSAGRYSMSCKVAVGGVSGSRSEALVASPWLLPIVPSGPGSYSYGQNTTTYGPPPTTPGLGYGFSGGAPDAASAAVVGCNSRPTDLVLPDGGTADIRILDASGNPVSGSGGSMPPDNLYLPGLGEHAALETSPLSSDGHQVVAQLAPGLLRIDGTDSILHCTGSGVTPDPSAAGAEVTITSGHTSLVTCRKG